MEISSDHYDFKGLGELRARADSRSEEAAREAGKQFEAMFFKMMLKSMREASEPMKSGLFDSAAMDNYTEMFDAKFPRPWHKEVLWVSLIGLYSISIQWERSAVMDQMIS